MISPAHMLPLITETASGNSLKKDCWRAVKLLLAQILNLDVNEQFARVVDYLRTENQVFTNTGSQ